MTGKIQEFWLWGNGIGSISGALGYGFNPQHRGLRIQYCHCCSVGCNCDLDLIPDWGSPYICYGGGQNRKKKKKKRKEKKNEQGTAETLNSGLPFTCTSVKDEAMRMTSMEE